jgi:hypothetical protein
MAVCIIVAAFCMAIFIPHVEHWNSLPIGKMKMFRRFEILKKMN